MAFKVPEKYRVGTGPYGSDSSYQNNGLFQIKNHKLKRSFRVIASDGAGWEHVSVSLQNRCPSWEEMCLIKDLFWGKDDCVIQYHPPESEYVNFHPHCLHLWRPINESLPMPHHLLVGIK